MIRGRGTPPATLSIGDPPVDVSIRRSAQARRFTLRLASATGVLTLTVPPAARERDIRQFLSAHHGWIAARRATLPPAVVPGPGTVLAVAGRTLTLAEAAGRSVRCVDGVLHVPGTGDAFRARLRGWLRDTARARAAARCDAHAAALGRSYGKLSLRDPRSRWGSCTSRGDIMLSWRLILAPSEVFDYVAAHEVAHLAEMNHSPAYWRVVAGLMPGYESHRRWLHANGAGLHRVQF